MLTELAVVHAHHEPKTRVEAAGEKRRAEVRLVVLVQQGQGRGMVDSSTQEGCFRGGVGHDLPYRQEESAARVVRCGAGGASGCRAEPAHQTGRAPLRGGLLLQAAFGTVAGDDKDNLFAVDVPQFAGQTVGEPVIPADHHVAGLMSSMTLMWQHRHDFPSPFSGHLGWWKARSRPKFINRADIGATCAPSATPGGHERQ